MIELLIKTLSEGENLKAISLISQNLERINEKTDNGNTLLMFAVYTQNIELCEYLLKNGANKNIKNSQGDSPETLAIKYNFLEVLNILNKY